MRGWVIALALLGCRRAPPVPRVDRSDGAIPTLRARRVADAAITVDGRIDEAAWRSAGRTLGFVHPGTGAPVGGSRVQAEAWVAWSDERLLVAFKVWDATPARAFRRDDEDPHVWERETGVEVMIQPGDPGDNDGYYELQVGASGALWATRFDGYNRPVTRDATGAMRFGHQSWSPQVERGVRVEGGALHVEMAVRWRDLQSARAMIPPRDGEVWRVNLYSFRDAQRDSLAWSPILGAGNFHRASRWGRVTFSR